MPKGSCKLPYLRHLLAPEVGLEPTTLRLTAECSAIELLRNFFRIQINMALKNANFINT